MSSTKEATTSPTIPRALTFSRFSEIAFIPNDNIESKWYSTQDKNRFRRSLIVDVRRMKRELEDKPTEANSPEWLYECLGLDKLISHDFMMQVAKKRRTHTDAVLSAQSLQKQQGVLDIEKLSRVSEDNSQWTRNRAQKLASSYSELHY
ncbi:hypothetical protein ACHAXR_011826 [Thalassiosira sp. AJA248-18]